MVQLSSYPLKTLFEMREKAKKASEEAFAAAKKEENAAQKKLDALKQELQKMHDNRIHKRDEFVQKTKDKSHILSINTFQVQNRHLDKLADDEKVQEGIIATQQGVLDAAKEKSKAAMDDLVKTTQELKVLEKHREGWQKSEQKIRDAKEEASLDEISQSQFLAHKREEQ